MNDKVCDCQFCANYKRFQIVLPLVPEEHREWFESIFDTLWNMGEDLEYKEAILDGSWPSSVKILEHRLANARKIRDLNKLADTPVNFDCKVCEKCGVPMTAAKYWNHRCDPNDGCEYGLTDEADPASDGEPADDGFIGGDHQGDFF
jgi:hypothetical protein